MIHGDIQPLFGQIHTVWAGQKLPCVGNRIALKVITKRKITQHLKKRMMPCGIADIVQIVMFAASADALLATGRSRIVTIVQAEKAVFKLIHAGIGKQ